MTNAISDLPRGLHFVGSLSPNLPPDPCLELKRVFEHSEGRALTALPCDPDPRWAEGYLRDTTGTRPEVFETVHDGGYTGYQDMRSNKVRKRVELRPEHVSANRMPELRRTLEAFRIIRSEHKELTDTRLQISVPNPLDPALFTFPRSPGNSLRCLDVSERAALDEAHELAQIADGDVVWQLENPSVLIGMNMVRMARLLRTWLTGRLVGQVGNLLARFPGPLLLLLHLCYGGFRHQEWFTPRSFGPAVKFLNGLRSHLRSESVTELPPVHHPTAHGAHPPPTARQFYEPPRNLHPEWRMIAGVVMPDDLEASLATLDKMERNARRETYAVAARGTGRIPESVAIQATKAMIKTAVARHDHSSGSTAADNQTAVARSP